MLLEIQTLNCIYLTYFFRLAAARKDAAQSVELMRERYLTICSNETDKNGLVIIVALYGKIYNGNYQSGHHEIRDHPYITWQKDRVGGLVGSKNGIF